MKSDFKEHWLRIFGLSKKAWYLEAEIHAANLSFSSPADTLPLVNTLFERVPVFLEKQQDRVSRLLAEAFAWVCYSFWQCGSAFPAFPENYAAFLQEQLFKESDKRDPAAILLARMIVEFSSSHGRCGFNRLVLANPDVVRESERRIAFGEYDCYLRAEEKYTEYEAYLAQSKEFQKEWNAIKKQFRKECCLDGILHRSLIPERNWIRSDGASFNSREHRFQAVFDLFCWKYFLWGMQKNKPLLMKPSVVFTPLGTQIFIPGYLSFDAKRDLDFGKITKLHKARGIQRQGEAFSTGRLHAAELKKRARQLDEQARSDGLKGGKRMDFIARQLNLPQNTDHRTIRKLLQRKKENHEL